MRSGTGSAGTYGCRLPLGGVAMGSLIVSRFRGETLVRLPGSTTVTFGVITLWMASSRNLSHSRLQMAYAVGLISYLIDVFP